MSLSVSIIEEPDLVQSNFGPRSNPHSSSVDVAVYSPPGLYYVSNFRERTAELLHVKSLVRAHVTPDSSIHDITENLAADVLAKFPAAVNTRIDFHPNIRRTIKIENLVRADCFFTKFNTRISHHTSELNSLYQVSTQWHLPISLQSGNVVSLVLQTREHSTSAVYDQVSALDTTNSRSRLSKVHPTFGVHEAVAKLSERLRGDRIEGAALLLAQSLFHFADEQSPCKRLQRVSVLMREIAPLTKRPRTKREKMVQCLEREVNEDPFTVCSVQLKRHQYEQSQLRFLCSDVQKGRHRAYLALGSNLGNRVENIESAIRDMSERGLTVLRTSALYETKPMYLENQESFINGACEVCSTDADVHSK